MADQYFVKDGYVIRPDNCYSVEEGITDNYQREVYERARSVATVRGYTRILDLGCGRGYKLVKYFAGFETLGLDLPPTVAYLRETYPEHDWTTLPLTSQYPGADVLICADVIEHILDPDELLGFIKRSAPKVLFISTPDRNLMPTSDHNGPPHNWCHVREWAWEEFYYYMAANFNVLEHFHSNRAQKTQCVIAEMQ
jgi:SAM-dependent methyltransferase